MQMYPLEQFPASMQLTGSFYVSVHFRPQNYNDCVYCDVSSRCFESHATHWLKSKRKISFWSSMRKVNPTDLLSLAQKGIFLWCQVMPRSHYTTLALIFHSPTVFEAAGLKPRIRDKSAFLDTRTSRVKCWKAWAERIASASDTFHICSMINIWICQSVKELEPMRCMFYIRNVDQSCHRLIYIGRITTLRSCHVLHTSIKKYFAGQSSECEIYHDL